MQRLLLGLSVVLLLAHRADAQVMPYTAGVALPPVCTIGQIALITGASGSPFPGSYFCTATNTWSLVAGLRTPAISLADNTPTNLYTVALPSANTSCTVHTSFTYSATNGTTSTTTHSGIVIWTFVNENGTVSGASTDSGEASVGTGCGAGCDAWPITVVSTTATAQATFNNTLNVTGALTFRVLNTSCATTALS